MKGPTAHRPRSRAGSRSRSQAARPAPEPVPTRVLVMLAVGMAALGFGLQSAALSYGFVNWDDWDYVVFNPMLVELDLEFLKAAFTRFVLGNWHPLTMISYGLDRALWGEQASGFHATNLLLHAANCALVMALAWMLFRRAAGADRASVFAAAVVAGVFAAHPLHVESVAWISERKDVLYAFFWLVSLIAWLGHVALGGRSETASEPASEPASEALPESPLATDPSPAADSLEGRRRRAYGLALVAFACSVMSKPMAVTLPVVLLLLDVYPLRRLGAGWPGLWRIVLEKLPFFAIALAAGIVTLVAQDEAGAIGFVELPPLARLWLAVRALGFYLAKFVAPFGLVPFYALSDDIPLAHWPYWSALVLVVCLTAGAILARRRTPVVAAGLAFYLVTLLPVLGLLQFGDQSAADRYTYLPLLGPAFILGAGGLWAWRSGPPARGIAVGGAIAFLIFLGWRTTDQVQVWRDSVSLWSRVVEAYPESTTGHYNLGHGLWMAGQPGQAERQWKRVLEIDPDHARALYELGASAGRARRYAEAERYLRAAVRSRPDDARSLVTLAMVLDERGDWPAAAHYYRSFLSLGVVLDGSYREHARARLAEGPLGGPR